MYILFYFSVYDNIKQRRLNINSLFIHYTPTVLVISLNKYQQEYLHVKILLIIREESKLFGLSKRNL
jgi:hypothetical protein